MGKDQFAKGGQGGISGIARGIVFSYSILLRKRKRSAKIEN
jgi:hypothetical protein